MKFTKDDILWYIDDVRWKLANTNIKATAALDIIYAGIEQSEDVLYQQGYDKVPSAEHHKLNIAEYIHDFYPDVWRHAEKELEVQPSAERVGKKGEWMPSHIEESILTECTNCGFDRGAYSFNFCPNCGARMVREDGRDRLD